MSTGVAEDSESAWYEWDADEADQGWLLTYVDVLSVILAMLLVLLAHLAPFQAPSMPDPEPAATPPAWVPASVAIPVPPIGPTASYSLVDSFSPGDVTRAEITEQPTMPGTSGPPPDSNGFSVRDRDEHGMTLEIDEVVLFDSARAQLKASAIPVLEQVARTLQEMGDVSIAVQGHTDNRPLTGGPFRSNWELASARANAVTGFLIEHGLPPQHLRAESYADTRPLADNLTDEGRAQNRRVALRVEFAGSEGREPDARKDDSSG